MDLGVRQIRTAGKGSGSIEVTLPTGLRDLVGLSCRILLHDGPRPHIALQPDLSVAQDACAALWRAMAQALICDQAPSGLDLTDFNLGFGLPAMAGPRPFLCWRDGLALSLPPPHPRLAIARTLAAFGQAQAASLGISAALAAGFGAACGFLATGLVPGDGAQEACDLTAFLLFGGGRPEMGPASSGPVAMGTARPGAPLAAAEAAGRGVVDAVFWTIAAPLFAAAAEQFQGWTTNPSSHFMLQAAWRRGRSIELSGD